MTAILTDARDAARGPLAWLPSARSSCPACLRLVRHVFHVADCPPALLKLALNRVAREHAPACTLARAVGAPPRGKPFEWLDRGLKGAQCKVQSFLDTQFDVGDPLSIATLHRLLSEVEFHISCGPPSESVP